MISSVAALFAIGNSKAQFIERVDFVGALSGDASQDWTKGWTNFDPQNTTYPAADETTTLNGASQGKIEISGTTTLDAGKVYLLKGLVVVKSGGKLVIPAGTIIRAEADVNAIPANYSSIIVEKGGMIEINGTSNSPVVITSNKAAGNRNRGDWGGIVICGKAKNNQGNDIQIEGFNNVAFDNALAKHGASDDNDNSGVIKYLRIEYGGLAFETNKEINGLTLGSVGKATTIEGVQVSYTNDDAFEWFGGNVNAKKLISYRNTDDDFDTDFGWGGAVQFGIAVRDTTQYDLTWNASSGSSTSETFESDNDAGGSGKTPYTRGLFTNITCVGPVPVGSSYSSMGSTVRSAFRRGARVRRNSRLSIVNSIFMGYRNFLMYDGDSSLIASGAKDSAFPTGMIFRNNIIVNTTAAASAGSTNTGLVEVASSNSSSLARFDRWVRSTQNANNINPVAYTAGTLLVDPQNPTAPDFKPVSASPALSGSDFTATRFNEFGTFTGVNHIENITDFAIFPNPATNNTNLLLNSIENLSVQVVISDLNGRVVYSESQSIISGINNIQISTAAFNNGIYIIRVVSEAGVLSSKLIVTK